MRSPPGVWLCALCVVALVWCACSKAPPQATTGAGGTAGTTEAATAGTTREGAGKTTGAGDAAAQRAQDQAIVAAVDQLFEGCPAGYLTRFDAPDAKLCKAPREAFLATVRASGFGAFGALATLFLGEDEARSRLAGWAMGKVLPERVGEVVANPTLAPAPVVAALAARLAAIDPLTSYRAQNMIALVVLLHGAQGQSAAAITALERLDPARRADSRSAYTKGLAHVMTYGRLGAFAFVKAQAEREDETIMARAFEAPLRMADWTEDEASVICPWAASKLAEARKDALPVPVLLRCERQRDTYRAQIADEASRRADARTLSPRMILAIASMCRPASANTTPQRAPDAADAPCARVMQTLTRTVQDDRAPYPARSAALGTLARTWPTADHLKLARQYTAHPHNTLSQTAREADRIIQRAGRPRTPADATPPPAPGPERAAPPPPL